MTRGHHLLAALRIELEAHGVHKVALERGGKHPRLVFTHEGKERSLVFPCTPSDPRSVANTLADLRRLLRNGRR